jgi:ABC-type multidrug transport system ATPase subunit
LKKHILEVSGIQKKFSDKLVLSDIYLKIGTGEIVGLLGHNGSGKSTLLKIISCNLTASDKSIFIDGVSRNNCSELVNEISYMCQDQFIPNHLSVLRTIELSVAKQKLNLFYEDDFLKPFLRQKIKNLPFGELRYLQVKLVLFNSSKFILLDEPFSGLSPKMIEIIVQLIKENSREKGILITDHQYENVMKISTILLLLKGGKLHKINEKAELVKNGYLTRPADF